MWTEINQKLPQHLAKSEDLLTGNFFGLLQYGNSKLLAKLLATASFRLGDEPEHDQNGQREFHELLNLLEKNELAFKFSFWPHMNRKFIDLIIEFPNQEEYLLGIELKYLSGISSNDFPDDPGDTPSTNQEEQTEHKKSRHQILEYAEEYTKKAGIKKAFFLIWGTLPITTDIVSGLRTTSKQFTQIQDLRKRKVFIGHTTWEQVHDALTKIHVPSNTIEAKICGDLVQYLKVKNLDGFVEFKDIENIPVAKLNPENVGAFEDMDQNIPNSNIYNALQVITQAHNNTIKLLDTITEEAISRGYTVYQATPVLTRISLNKNNIFEWIPRDFFKVFAKKEHPNELFTVEINLHGAHDNGYPAIFLGRHEYDRTPEKPGTMEDVAIFNQRLWNRARFDADEEAFLGDGNEFFYTYNNPNKPGDQGRPRGFKKAIFKKIKLIGFKQAQIQTDIFDVFPQMEWKDK